MTYKNIYCVADKTPKAQEFVEKYVHEYNFSRLDYYSSNFAQSLNNKDGEENLLVIFGGDGFIIRVLHKIQNNFDIDVYGINCGTVGFLLNSHEEKDFGEFFDILSKTERHLLSPLKMSVTEHDGRESEEIAINEVSLFRQTNQSAKIGISVNGQLRMKELVGDGILLATPAGSTAYNIAAGGFIIPLDANILALTPINPFKPRRWRSVLIPEDSFVEFEVLNHYKRPVSSTADFIEIRNILHARITRDPNIKFRLLFNSDYDLSERIVKEQFMI